MASSTLTIESLRSEQPFTQEMQRISVLSISASLSNADKIEAGHLIQPP